MLVNLMQPAARDRREPLSLRSLCCAVALVAPPLRGWLAWRSAEHTVCGSAGVQRQAGAMLEAPQRLASLPACCRANCDSHVQWRASAW